MTCPGCGAPDDQDCYKGCPDINTRDNIRNGFQLTSDELTCIIEALREYRLRVGGNPARKLLCEALIFRALAFLTQRDP